MVFGLICLASALKPTKDICDRKQRVASGWKFLGVFIVLFMVGYLSYGYMLTSGPSSTLKTIVSVILLGGGIFVAMVVRLSRISIERVEDLAEQQKHRAVHDNLTELPNRILLEERLDYAVVQAKRRQERFVLLLMDLNRFKEINDTLGHFYGDYVLQEMANRLQGQIRESDTLARIGGDEFALILPQIDAEQASNMCHKIALVSDQPFNIEGNRINVGLSIGVAIYPDHGADSEALIHNATSAMCEAKKNDVIYAFFHPSQDKSSLDRLILAGELREAILKDQMVLHYQPKVSAKGQLLNGVEALVRWQHPQRGMIPPNDFIPLIEQAGLSKMLTLWVLDNAIKQSRIWSEDGLNIRIAVNLSIKNLHDVGFPGDVERLLHKWKVEPKMLVMEITESCMMADPKLVHMVVVRLKELGVQLSIDDFGTGYSSLSYLRKFPAKEIKIDRSFVTDMCANKENAIIVKSTIEMVHNIGCLVVAEGVEDEETFVKLAELKCDFLQGFHISRPLTKEKLEEWLNESSWSLTNDEDGAS